MRVLLLGAQSMLARDLIREAPPWVSLVSSVREQTDVTIEGEVTAALRDAEPDVVVNCAGYTDVDGAESHPSLAFAVNEGGPGTLGRAVARSGSRALVVHYSTDYVFSGRSRQPYREGDPVEPLGIYGASKLAGEGALLESGAPCLIIRTQWVFGLGGRSFPRTMWERAQGGHVTRVVEDQIGRPTYTVDLARATWRLVGGAQEASGVERGSEGSGTADATHRGIVHVANTGTASWYDVARHVFEAAGRAELLTPCTTSEFPRPAPRPSYSVLDTSRYESIAKQPLPPWPDAVDRLLIDLQAETST